eukprot:GEMP01003081.1.p1 GENE.GEMP01003081.1~~GEMP01003081.1.p1  ORF type:complete len:1136 (+),score=241.99 GEMP01003081.1:37-3444(+)
MADVQKGNVQLLKNKGIIKTLKFKNRHARLHIDTGILEIYQEDPDAPSPATLIIRKMKKDESPIAPKYTIRLSSFEVSTLDFEYQRTYKKPHLFMLVIATPDGRSSNTKIVIAVSSQDEMAQWLHSFNEAKKKLQMQEMPAGLGVADSFESQPILDTTTTCVDTQKSNNSINLTATQLQSNNIRSSFSSRSLSPTGVDPRVDELNEESQPTLVDNDAEQLTDTRNDDIVSLKIGDAMEQGSLVPIEETQRSWQVAPVPPSTPMAETRRRCSASKLDMTMAGNENAWGSRLWECISSPSELPRLVGDFLDETTRFSKEIVQYLVFNEVEIALNGCELRTVRHLMTKLVQQDASTPLNGVLVNSVEFMGFRVVCYAMMPDWPIVHGVVDGKVMETDENTQTVVSHIEHILNLKATRVKMVGEEATREIHLSPSLHIRRDAHGVFWLSRPRERILPPLAPTEAQVECENERSLRPELLHRLPNPLSPIPSPDFSDDVTYVEQSSKLKREIVDAYTFLTTDVITALIKKLDSLQKFPIHVRGLRTCFHEEGVNMCFLGLVSKACRIPYVQALCEVDALGRAAKRMLREEIRRETLDHSLDFDMTTEVALSLVRQILEGDTEMWHKLGRMLKVRYGFADVPKWQNTHCHQLIASIEHHAAIRLSMEDDDAMPEKIGEEWTEVAIRMEFIPSIKTVDYRALSHAVLIKKPEDDWTERDVQTYLQYELALSKVCFGPVVSDFLRQMLEDGEIPACPEDSLATEAILKSSGHHGFDEALRCLFESGHFTCPQQKENAWQLARSFYERCPEAYTKFLTLGLEDEFIKLDEAKAEIVTMFGADHPLILQCLKRVGTQYWDEHGAAAALPLFQECLEFCKDKFGAMHCETACCHSMVGHLHLETEDFTNANLHFEFSKRIAIKIHGEVSLEACGAYRCLQKSEMKRGYFEAATYCARKAHGIQVALTRPDHDESIKLNLSLAHLVEKSNELEDLPEALERYQECLTMLDQRLKSCVARREDETELTDRLNVCIRAVVRLTMKSLSMKKQSEWETRKQMSIEDEKPVARPEGIENCDIAEYLQRQLDLCAGSVQSDRKSSARMKVVAVLRWADGLASDDNSLPQERVKQDRKESDDDIPVSPKRGGM